MGWGTAKKGQELTTREREVLDMLVATGESNKLIGDYLGISIHAVKFHLKNACVKLGLATRVQAAVHWVRFAPQEQSAPQEQTSG